MAKKQCNGLTKEGAPCGAPAGSGGLCFLHANPQAARALGQIGGRKNRARMQEPPVAGSLSAVDLRGILAHSIQEVISKKMSPRVGSTVSQLCNSAHRIILTADLEARVGRLEEQLAQKESRVPMVSDATAGRRLEKDHAGADAEPGDTNTPVSEDVEGRNDGSGEDEKA